MVAQKNHQITKYAAENKWHGDLFTNGENLTTKTPLGDFQVTTPEIPYYQNKRLQVKESQYLIPTYPNTQLDLFCSDNFPFWCTASKYMTNQLRGSQYETSITN